MLWSLFLRWLGGHGDGKPRPRPHPQHSHLGLLPVWLASRNSPVNGLILATLVEAGNPLIFAVRLAATLLAERIVPEVSFFFAFALQERLKKSLLSQHLMFCFGAGLMYYLVGMLQLVGALLGRNEKAMTSCGGGGGRRRRRRRRRTSGNDVSSGQERLTEVSAGGSSSTDTSSLDLPMRVS